MAIKHLQANANFEVNFNRLDESQRAPIEDEYENIVVRAPAGSGKTTVLLTAIAAYRYEHLNDRICAITYTRAARAEMESRLKEMGIYDVEVTTIHVWARNLLQDFSLKYDFRVRVLQEGEIMAILENIVSQYSMTRQLKSRINVSILYTYVMGNKNMDVSDTYRRTLKSLEALYIIYKEDNMLYDCNDYPKYLYDVMQMYNESIYSIDALFVDEFQDVDKYQLWTFDRVFSNKKFYIGDPKQSIYIFRGADGEVFKKLSNFHMYKLKYNYRSKQEIIDVATSTYKYLSNLGERDEGYITAYDNEIRASQDVVCNKGYGGDVYLFEPFGSGFKYHEDTMVRCSFDVFDQMLYNNAMILCRTNKQVRGIQELGFTNVSTVHQAKGLEYDNVIVIDSTVCSMEDMNIAYVALTRAKDKMLIINFPQFIEHARRYIRNTKEVLI